MIILNLELKVPNVLVKGRTVDLLIKNGNKRIFIEVNNIYNEDIRRRIL